MATKKYYAVAKGRKPGIYTEWFGDRGAKVQIDGFPGAVYKGFTSREEASAFLAEKSQSKKKVDKGKKTPKGPMDNPDDAVVVFTDGGALYNPGPGGYGAVILQNGNRTELSEGYRLTTNNRMELMACIAALKKIKAPAKVVVHSDSQYVVNGITKGWAKRWRKNNWMRTKTDPAVNPDLWGKLLELCEKHRWVKFQWVKGHAGHQENERCDALAVSAARSNPTRVDKIYESTL